MERLILDTGVLIAAERGRARLPDTDADVAIAAITASELLLGMELADGRRRARRSQVVERVLETADILAFDLVAARHHARLTGHVRRIGDVRGAHDLIIAATAAATGRTVLTTDRTGFCDLPGVLWQALPAM
ncbi:MAG TPA: PIN domain-containing protein [Baekduia sp.]|nr:PIN domain-containing protein [Baekduia sp.]